MINNVSIEKVISAPGVGAFFYDDQNAIRSGVIKNGEMYEGTPSLPGFSSIRMPAESLSLGLLLSDGYCAWGDVMSVQYPGVGGRERPIKSEELGKLVNDSIASVLRGVELLEFTEIGMLSKSLLKDVKIQSSALEYGLSQALIVAYAHVKNKTIAEVICDAHGLNLQTKMTPLYAQSGDNRETNTDKMILKRVDYLPHGLINTQEKFGHDGEAFLNYVGWVKERIIQNGNQDYQPHLYFDIYGMAGVCFSYDIDRICEFCLQLERLANPFHICLESPVDFGSRDDQLSGYIALRKGLTAKGCNVKMSLDEWCNTIDDIQLFTENQAADFIHIKMPDLGSVWNAMEAVRVCKKYNVKSLLGGSCTETDISARIAAHIALALNADAVLAKPGMGVDEGITIVRNEQSRILAQYAARQCAD